MLSTPPDSTQTLFVNDFSYNTLPSSTAVPITLNYHSTKGNKAISCSVFNVVNFTISRSCECNEDGQCSVEILKGAQATLFGQFSFAVFDGEEVSNPAIFSHRDNSAFSNSFVTLWDISSDNLTLSLPLRSGFLYDFVVDWGDGSALELVQTPAATHTYFSPGVYRVRMIGVYEYFGNYYCSDYERRLLSVEQWGTNAWKSMYKSFCKNTKVQFTANDIPNLSQVTDMGFMFSEASEFNSNIDNWNTSQVINMSSMFNNASVFNQDLTSWPVNPNVATCFAFNESSLLTQMPSFTNCIP